MRPIAIEKQLDDDKKMVRGLPGQPSETQLRQQQESGIGELFEKPEEPRQDASVRFKKP